MRTLLLTLTTGLLVVSTAQAKYSGGSGTAEDPYQIATAADLIALGETPDDYGKHFILTADIDLDPSLPAGRTILNGHKAVIAPAIWTDLDPHVKGIPFNGVFDGDGRTISRLTITGGSYLGLFGHLGPGATISHLGLKAVKIEGISSVSGPEPSVGGLVGLNEGSIVASYCTGSVRSDQDRIGGLAGDNRGKIAASHSDIAIEGISRYANGTWTTIDRIGGLVGYNTGSVISSYSSGSISGNSEVGGLVGSNNGGDITASYSTGSVGGTGDIGGLVGLNTGSVVASYSSGSARGAGFGAASVGGLVGVNEGSIVRSYSSGSFNGTGSVGGLAARNEGNVKSSFWDVQTSGQSASAGGLGLTTPEMMDPNTLALNGFANDPNWVLDAGRDYPRLVWQGTPGDIIPEVNMDWLAGQGTADSPYRIDTVDQLIFLSKASPLWNRHFVLGADIDLDPALPGRQTFRRAVISVFAGVFDGGGHTISHLTIQGSQDLGLFGSVTGEAEVRNIGVVDVNIIGSAGSIGGLAGSNEGNIVASHSSGWVSGRWSVGGLVGMNSGGTIASSYSGAVVNGGSAVGGLVGDSHGSIVASHSGGFVRGTDWYVGGLVGFNLGSIATSYSRSSVRGTNDVGGLVGFNGRSIVASYSTGAVSGVGSVGGLVGSNSSQFYPSGSVNSSFWDIQTSGRATSVGGTGKTTAEMQDPKTFMAARWDFIGQPDGAQDLWAKPEGGGYPVLWWQLASGFGLPVFSGGTGERDDPYRISRPEELNRIADNPRLMNCHFRLVQSLDLTGLPFDPIGSLDFPYRGVFDGNDLTVSHLTIKGARNLGLFGYLAGVAEVRNVRVVDANIIGSAGSVGGLAGSNAGRIVASYSSGSVSGTDHVGGLAGANSGSISSSSSRGSVSGTVWYIGGLVGENSGSVSSSSSSGSVSGTDWSVGGLVGASWGGDITSSYNNGSVSGTGSVGGLVGFTWGASIVTSYSSGSVNGAYHVGGLVGSNGGNIVASYSTGPVSGNEYVGGLAGSNWASAAFDVQKGSITNSYSRGSVRGTNAVGGLVGNNDESGGIASCFWDVQNSGWMTSAGGTGKTTAEMQRAKTFLDAGWDFMGETANGTEDLWWIDEGKDYPRLWWEAAAK